MSNVLFSLKRHLVTELIKSRGGKVDSDGLVTMVTIIQSLVSFFMNFFPFFSIKLIEENATSSISISNYEIDLIVDANGCKTKDGFWKWSGCRPSS